MEMQKQWDKFKYIQNMKIILFSLLLAYTLALANPQQIVRLIAPSLGLSNMPHEQQAIQQPILEEKHLNPWHHNSGLPPPTPAPNPMVAKALPARIVITNTLTNQTNSSKTTNQTSSSNSKIEKKQPHQNHPEEKSTPEYATGYLGRTSKQATSKTTPTHQMGYLGKTPDSIIAPPNPKILPGLDNLRLGGMSIQAGLNKYKLVDNSNDRLPFGMINPLEEHVELSPSKTTLGIASQSFLPNPLKSIGAYECLDSPSAAKAMTQELRLFASQMLADQKVQNYLLLLVCQKGVRNNQVLNLLYATDEGHLEMTVGREGAIYRLRSKTIYFTGMQLSANVAPAYAIA